MIYLDNAATTRLCDEAFDAMLPLLREDYGNPSSQHEMGQRAAAVLFAARRDIAQCLGCEPYEVFFTSGGSEADSMALLSAARLGARLGRRHIVSQKTEHHAVLNALKMLETEGYRATLLPPDGEGRIAPEAVERALTSDTALVTIMAANNEIGTVQPITDIAEICRRNGVLFHTDAVQAAGHIPIDVREIGCDMLSLSAHKFHGPKGAGVLYVRGGVEILPLIYGGNQERGKRGGTENVAAIAGMAAALKRACSDLRERTERISSLRDLLTDGLLALPRTRLNGSRTERLCNNVSICFGGQSGERLVYALSRREICVSAGAACSSGTAESHVLRAIGLTHDEAASAVRFSLSEFTSEEEIRAVISAVKELIS